MILPCIPYYYLICLSWKENENPYKPQDRAHSRFQMQFQKDI